MPRSTKSPARSPAPEPIGGISDGRYITKDSHPVVTFPDCNQIDETRALSTCGASLALIVTLLAAVWWAPSAAAWPAAHQVPATDRAETWDYRGAVSLALDWLMLALLGLPVYLCKRADRWFTDETAAERWGMNAYPIGKSPLRATAAMFFGLGATLVVYPLNYWMTRLTILGWGDALPGAQPASGYAPTSTEVVLHQWFGIVAAAMAACILVVTETASSPRQLRLLNAAVACAIFTGCVMFAKNLVDNTQPAYWCTACIALFGPVGVMALNEALRL